MRRKPMGHRLSTFVGILAPCILLTCSCALAKRSEEFLPGQQAGVIQSDLIQEASGIVASRRNPGVLWVHNDSGDQARVFAIDTKGDLLGVCTIRGATCRDWEDIAIGPGPDPNQPCLYIGDIGDNLAKYPSVIVYRLPEPKVEPGAFGTMTAGPAEAIRLTYPDGPRDAETLLLDPLTRDLYIIAKRELFSKVYRAAFPQSTTETTRMEAVTTLPWGFATAGDVSPDGRRIIVRGMFSGASMWQRRAGEPLWRAFADPYVSLPLMSEPQGEGICFDANGRGYFTIGEMRHPPLHYFGPSH
jgi:hypothetical protein